ncbi:MAG TPA: (Fe-S)-binding protein [Bacteroidales bacterium]|nr:(Fe-S)-binding protein [Bacteroidales bacterium]
MLVDIFIPCFIDQIYPQTGMNMVKILEKLGVDVHYNGNQTCCGQMAFNSGFWDEAKEMGAKFIRDFPNDRPVISPSASCSGMIKNYYPWLFHNTALHYEYKQLKKNMVEFTDFLVNVLKMDEIGAEFNHLVTYHDSCAALREYGIREEPRALLSKVKGLTLKEMNNNDVCCGFGGTFSVKFESISTAMAEQKVKHALETGAEYIVSTDSSCLMHQQAYIDKHHLPMKTMHIIDVLASGW